VLVVLMFDDPQNGQTVGAAGDSVTKRDGVGRDRVTFAPTLGQSGPVGALERWLAQFWNEVPGYTMRVDAGALPQ